MKKYQLLFITLIMLAALACHKYKEDDFISLRKPGKRLEGSWHIVAFNVDGADSLNDLFKRTNYANCNFQLIYDKKNHKDKWIGCIDNWTNVGGISDANYDFWIFNDYFIHPLKFDDNTTVDYKHFKINKLIKKDFWISIDMDGKHYEIKFKKQ
ncbi:MAG: hypothetical protein RL065_1571 [Bacteroidota bacterium]